MTKSSISDFTRIPANARSLGHRKPLFGAGVNDADYMVRLTVDGKSILCPFYHVWVSMLERVYSAKFHAKRPTYIKCTVCDAWLSFMTFREWMDDQGWQDKCLDKDLLIPGNKHYSPDRCMFVTQAINNLLCDSGAARGAYPRGVYYHKSAGRYLTRVKRGNGKSEYIGYFDTPEAASAAYKKAKSAYIRKVASEQTDPLRSALYNHADLIAANHGA